MKDKRLLEIAGILQENSNDIDSIADYFGDVEFISSSLITQFNNSTIQTWPEDRANLDNELQGLMNICKELREKMKKVNY